MGGHCVCMCVYMSVYVCVHVCVCVCAWHQIVCMIYPSTCIALLYFQNICNTSEIKCLYLPLYLKRGQYWQLQLNTFGVFNPNSGTCSVSWCQYSNLVFMSLLSLKYLPTVTASSGNESLNFSIFPVRKQNELFILPGPIKTELYIN